jgi:hypothetical protein
MSERVRERCLLTLHLVDKRLERFKGKSCLLISDSERDVSHVVHQAGGLVASDPTFFEGIQNRSEECHWASTSVDWAPVTPRSPAAAAIISGTAITKLKADVSPSRDYRPQHISWISTCPPPVGTKAVPQMTLLDALQP